MKPIPAIVEQVADLAAEQIIVWRAEESDAERSVARHEKQASDARATAAARRMQIGELLTKQRAKWPTSGPRARGWGEWLAKAKLDDSTAWRYMDAWKNRDQPARDVGDPSQQPAVRGKADPLSEAREDGPETQAGREDGVEIDRDTWCTPSWLTEPLGHFDLDPCSNARSQVQAGTTFVLEQGIDGLARGEDVSANWRVFVNPPYSDVGPWIAAYKHTRFCFLLKLDTSTRWFADLHAATELILIPRRRVNFIPPPGVPADKAVAQQFPHALFYAHAEDALDAIRALCWSWRVTD